MLKKVKSSNGKKDESKSLQKIKKNREKCENCKRCWGFCEFLSTSWKLFKEFSAHTSIHGIKYLTDKKRHWSEKIFWAVALIMSIAACSYLIYDSFWRWKAAPVIVSFSEKFMNIWEIPFAAITICPIGGIPVVNSSYNSSDIQSEALNNFTGSIEKRITRGIWRKSEMHSEDLFTEIATSEGFCWTFNMLNYDDLFVKDV
jgi:ferredoxin